LYLLNRRRRHDANVLVQILENKKSGLIKPDFFYGFLV
jgi:hypothetical protein